MSIDLDKLEQMAQGATRDVWLPSSWPKRVIDHYDELFIEAVSPDVVLELITELRRLRKEPEPTGEYGYVIIGSGADRTAEVERLKREYPGAHIIVEQLVRDKWKWLDPVNPRGLYSESDLYSQVDEHGNKDFQAIIITDCGHYPPYGPDKDFLAHVRDDVPALIAEVRRLRELSKPARTKLLHPDEGDVLLVPDDTEEN